MHGIIHRMYPAIFLDRDGVIIENRPDYVRSWQDVFIYPQALSALARISSSPYKIILVTNQSAIGRGIISFQTGAEINDRLVNEIRAAGGRIDGVFMCPHAPEDGCDCRKPRPGLFYQAAQALSLDLKNSVMIGDALTDLLAASSAGIQRVILVRTGRGAEQERLPEAGQIEPLLVSDSLSDALSELI
jgi:D-glycero-D-manno-heptose 1,7-bisphosphate phosphatase